MSIFLFQGETYSNLFQKDFIPTVLYIDSRPEGLNFIGLDDEWLRQVELESSESKSSTTLLQVVSLILQAQYILPYCLEATK